MRPFYAPLAHFSEAIMDVLDYYGVDFTASVPFERFPELKAMVEQRKRWRCIDREWSYFEAF